MPTNKDNSAQHVEYKRRVAAQVREHEPTDEQRDQVMALMFADTRDEIVARLIGVTGPVLRRCYRYELKNGKEIVAAKLKLGLIKDAVKGDKGVRGALARAMGLGRDTPPPETPKPNARPPGDARPPIFDVAALTDDGLAQILADIDKGADPPDRPRRARAA